jgi:hypothetical protein
VILHICVTLIYLLNPKAKKYWHKVCVTCLLKIITTAYPYLEHPHLAHPHLEHPHLEHPHLAHPHLAHPHLAHPHLAHQYLSTAGILS